LADDLKLHRCVAMKIVTRQGVRILREAVGGAKLIHPNVVDWPGRRRRSALRSPAH
jgi:hypothetical protein